MSPPPNTAGQTVVPTPAVAPVVLLWRAHLDAILGLGEALVRCTCARPHRVDSGDSVRALLQQNRTTLGVVGEIQGLESALVLRLQQASRLAGDVAAREGGAVRDIARLWKAGQQGVLASLDAPPAARTSPYIDPAAYLRSRRLLPSTAAGLVDLAHLVVHEDMAVMGVARLRDLLDAAAAALDSLDAAGIAP